MEKSQQNALARGRQLCTQLSNFEGSLAQLLRFWCRQCGKLRKSCRIASFLTFIKNCGSLAELLCFLMLPRSKIEKVSQNSFVFKLAGRQIDRQTGRQRGREADSQTDKQADRQTGRQADRQPGSQAARQPGRQTDRQTTATTTTTTTTLHYAAATTTHANPKIPRYTTLHKLHLTALITVHYSNYTTLHQLQNTTLTALHLQLQLLLQLHLQLQPHYATLH